MSSDGFEYSIVITLLELRAIILFPLWLVYVANAITTCKYPK
jgi:hypothetical protein